MFFSRSRHLNRNNTAGKTLRALRAACRPCFEVLEERKLLSAAFLGATTTPVALGSTAMVTADFNGDGHADFAIASRSTGRVSVMLGSGDGTYQATTTLFPGTQAPAGLVVSDFNNDGHLDIGVIGGDLSTFVPVIHVLLGNGDGTFQAPNTFPEPNTASLGAGFGSVTAADVNGDGWFDLLAVNPAAGSTEVLLGNGDGSFTSGATYATGVGSGSVITGDFNHDGLPDLAVSSTGTAADPRSLSILPGNGDGTFGAAASYSAQPGGAVALAATDLNGDGNVDVVTIGGDGKTRVWAGNGDGTLAAPVILTTKFSANSVIIADVNGDGIPDLVEATTNGLVSVMAGNGDLTFQPEFDNADGGNSFLTLQDANGDGHADLVGVNTSTATLETVLGDGDGSFQSAIVYDQANLPNPVAGLNLNPPSRTKFFADFNGDGIQDFAAADATRNTVSVSLGNPDGTFRAPITFVPQHLNTQPHPQIISAGDFNGDGKADLIIYNPGLPETVTVGGGEAHVAAHIIPGTPSTWTLYLSNGDGTFAPSTVTTALQGPGALSVTADLNGDGLADNIFAFDTGTSTGGPTVGMLQVQLSTGAKMQSYFIGGKPNSVTVADLNGDGRPDIAVASGNSNKVYVLINNGDGTFSLSATAGIPAYTVLPGLPQIANGTFGLKVADFNQDGKADIAVATALGQIAILYGNGDGTFTSSGTFDIGGNPTVLGVGDFNGDGFPDIAAPIGTNVSVALNAGIGETLGAAVGLRVTAAPSAVAGEPQSATVTAVDANGNVAAGFLGTIRLASSDPRATIPTFYTFTAADAGSHMFTGIVLDAAGTDTIIATNPRIASGTTAVNVTHAAAANFTVTLPLITVGAGNSFNFTVMARDAFGNAAPDYAGTVQFSSSDTRAGLPASYTFTPADAGVHTFSAVFDYAMPYTPPQPDFFNPGSFFPAQGSTITVTDTAIPTITGTGLGVNIVAAPAASFSVSSNFSNGTVAGASGMVFIIAQDVFGNFATNYAGTIHLTSSDALATLPATLVASQGSVMAFNVVLRTAGAVSLTATDAANSSVTGSTTQAIVAGAPVSISISAFPAATAGAAQSVTVSARDVFGNIASGYLGTVHFSSSDVQAGLPANYTFTAADPGTHTFTVTLKTAGTQSVTVADTLNPSFTVTQLTAVAPATVAAFAVAGFPATTAGVSHTFTVTAQDAFGNTVTGYIGTVKFSSGDVQAGLPAAYAFTASDAGVHTFTAMLKTGGAQSILVQDTVMPAISGSALGIFVSPAAASRFAISAPSTATTGKSISVTLTVLDAFGNVASAYRGKVHVSDTVSAGLPSDSTFSANDAGSHTFSVTLNTAGLQTLTFADTVTTALKASVNITASAATGGGGTGGGGGSGGGK